MGIKMERRRNNISILLEVIVVFVAAIMMGYGVFQLADTYLDYKSGSDVYADVKETYIRKPEPEEEENGSDNPEEVNPVDFAGLKSRNQDIVGWLMVEGLDISYPIMQSDDNEYYLKYTFDRKYHFGGSIFMDCGNSPDFTDQNTILYGHNMKDGSMFGKLKKYRSQEVYDENLYIWVYTPDEVCKYEVISCREVDADGSAYQLQFRDLECFASYVGQAIHGSIIKPKKDIHTSKDDVMITLSTCSNNSDTRFIVQGIRICVAHQKKDVYTGK